MLKRQAGGALHAIKNKTDIVKKNTSQYYCKATRTNKKNYKMKNARPAQVRQWLRRGNGVSFRRFIPRARHLPSQGAT